MKTRARGWSAPGLFLLVASALALFVVVGTWSHEARANPTYADCAGCHGGFEDDPYTRLGADQGWGTDLMSGHLRIIENLSANTECGVCHEGGFGTVSTFSSDGVDGQFTQGCLGCHGRFEPSLGMTGSTEASGLRQHHYRAGITSCATCHPLDSNPGVYAPVGENILPPNYDLDLSVVALTDPCNTGGVGEDFAGDSGGLDNDGDNAYDVLDIDCAGPTPTPATPTPATPTPATPTPATPTPATPTPATPTPATPTPATPTPATATPTPATPTPATPTPATPTPATPTPATPTPATPTPATPTPATPTPATPTPATPTPATPTPATPTPATPTPATATPTPATPTPATPTPATPTPATATPTPATPTPATPTPPTPTPATATPSPTPTAEPPQTGKVALCHKLRRTISVSVNAMPAHFAHGDTMGVCAGPDERSGSGPKGTPALTDPDSPPVASNPSATVTPTPTPEPPKAGRSDQRELVRNRPEREERESR